jgi:GDP-4-dehydro-6-deoxy-D-mannose reductase
MATTGRKALVTGARGFCGQHLMRHLKENGWQASGVDLEDGDIRDMDAVERILKEASPDVVFHLAGIAYPPEAQAKPAFAWAINADGARNVMAASWAMPKRPRVALVSSAYVVYGNPEIERGPITEEEPLAPRDTYAAGKAAAEILAREWAGRGLDVVIARPFNHIGPGQREDFVAPAFALQIARIEAGRIKNRLFVGNLDAVRDLSDVRDVAQAYRMLAEKGKPGKIYNVCSGAACSIQSVLDGLLAHAKCRIYVQTDPERLRPSEHARLVGDASLIKREIGWAPAFSFEQTLADIMEDARQRVALEKKPA